MVTLSDWETLREVLTTCVVGIGADDDCKVDWTSLLSRIEDESEGGLEIGVVGTLSDRDRLKVVLMPSVVESGAEETWELETGAVVLGSDEDAIGVETWAVVLSRRDVDTSMDKETL